MNIEQIEELAHALNHALLHIDEPILETASDWIGENLTAMSVAETTAVLVHALANMTAVYKIAAESGALVAVGLIHSQQPGIAPREAEELADKLIKDAIVHLTEEQNQQAAH